jgi:hypothetical protein
MKAPTVSSQQRAIEMFKLYLEGKTHQEIADQYGVSKTVVSRIAQKKEWKNKLIIYYQRAYDEAITIGAKKTGAQSMQLLGAWVSKTIRKVKDGQDISLDEVKEVRQIFVALAEENRLADHKPTQVISGVVRHEVILSPGVQHFGVDPPGPGVIEVTAEPEKKNKDDALDGLED